MLQLWKIHVAQPLAALVYFSIVTRVEFYGSLFCLLLECMPITNSCLVVNINTLSQTDETISNFKWVFFPLSFIGQQVKNSMKHMTITYDFLIVFLERKIKHAPCVLWNDDLYFKLKIYGIIIFTHWFILLANIIFIHSAVFVVARKQTNNRYTQKLMCW